MLAVATGYTLDASLITPIVDAITANVAVLVPVGISVMAIFVSLRLIPRIIHMFM